MKRIGEIVPLICVGLFAHTASMAAHLQVRSLGSFAQWAPIDIELLGPDSVGRAEPNPFSLVVDGLFTSPSGRTIRVPGFYDGDGRGGLDGNAWKVRFAADEIGAWTFRSRSENSILDGIMASFVVTPPPDNAADFYRWGRLEAVGTAENRLRYLKFRDGP